MRGALAAVSSTSIARLPSAAVRGAVTAGGCSSSGRRELPSFSSQQRRRRRPLVSVPPSFASADGAFSNGGGEEDEVADPFALAEGDIPAEVAAQFAAAAAVVGGGEDSEETSTSTSTIDEEQFEGGSGKVRAFSRVGEKDPYRLLGVQRDASFEEIQDARNYLSLTYRSHERSREAVEGAFDSILKERMRLRHKLGFRPPKAGRGGKTDFTKPKRSLAARVGMLFDPLVTLPTIVNSGSIFLALALWAALQANASDPTFPVLGSICYCGWRVFDKRRKREGPDGKFFGGSPIWGALGTTLLALLAGFVASLVVVRVADAASAALPVLAKLRPASTGLFVICLTLGAVSIFFR